MKRGMDMEQIKAKVRLNQYMFSQHADIEAAMVQVKCSFCGSDQHEERRIEYLYSRGEKYLLVPNTPVEVCSKCGMIYYEAAVLKAIEDHFLAIQNKSEAPDRYIRVPEKALS